MSDKPKFWIGKCGALLCDRQINGLTQSLTGSSGAWYGSPFFVGESIRRDAAKVIAEALGGEYLEAKPE